MHNIGIVHQGLNPKNIMFDSEGHLVISDFSWAEFSCPTETLQTVLPNKQYIMAEYVAPEILLGWRRNYAVDCWSFGMLVYFMLFGVVRGLIIEPMPCIKISCSIRSRKKMKAKTAAGYTIKL